MPKDYFDYKADGDEEEMSEAEKENKVLEFVYQVTRKSCPPGEYVSWLQDGKIIEEVIFKSCPTPLGKRQRSLPDASMKAKERVEKIINDLFEFGVGIDLLFDVDDLVKARNIPKVTACLAEVKMMVYTGQGRSKLKSVQDVVKASFRCTVCKEKFALSDQLRNHLCEKHPDKIGENLFNLLKRMMA